MCETAYQRILRIACPISAASKPPTESVQVAESPSASSYVESSSLGCSPYTDGITLESSASSAVDDFLLRSGGVRYSLSLWDLEEYIEEHESLRRVRYTQFCQSDRNPPSFEWYNLLCESAYKRILRIVD